MSKFILLTHGVPPAAIRIAVDRIVAYEDRDGIVAMVVDGWPDTLTVHEPADAIDTLITGAGCTVLGRPAPPQTAPFGFGA